ncbi:hypothetical protein N431DRAFT_353909, partial [Stipitochalara longipes BDJ]
GWPRVAAFLNSDDNFAVFRGFSHVHSRILLMLQVEITKLESKLSELDRHDDASEATHYRLKSTRHEEGWDTAQNDLLEKLRMKVLDYGKWNDLLLKAAQIRALKKTPRRDHRKLFNWIWRLKPVDKGEYDWIYHANDFVSLEPDTDGQWAEVFQLL